MSVAFVPLNPRDHQATAPSGHAPIPLKPAESPMGLPQADKPVALERGAAPKSFAPSFKDIYLQRREELRKGADGMEAMLVRQVMKAMRSTIPEPEEDEDLFGSAGHATKMFTQMMDDELSNKISANGRVLYIHSVQIIVMLMNAVIFQLAHLV